MIQKICSKCKKLYPVGKSCPNGCNSYNRKEYNRYYDKHIRKNKDIYKSKQWEIVRRKCLNRYDNICLYTYFKYKKIVPATLVHHIVEITVDKTKAFDINNLIPVSELAHREIHKRYRDENIKEVQKELHRHIKLYTTNYLRGEGV